jgi:hypothetical protein
MAGAALASAGQIHLSGSATSSGALSTTSILNAAQGGDPYNESSISSGYKTDTSLTTINQLFDSSDFETGNGSYNASAPHTMVECRTNYEDSGGGPGR